MSPSHAMRTMLTSPKSPFRSMMRKLSFSRKSAPNGRKNPSLLNILARWPVSTGRHSPTKLSHAPQIAMLLSGSSTKKGTWSHSWKYQSYCLESYLTLLMAQWVDMKALENKKHASLLCFFDSLGAIRQISFLESASSRVVTHKHALSAWFFSFHVYPLSY